MKNKEISELPEENTLYKNNNIIEMKVIENKKLTTDSFKLYNFFYLAFQYNRENILKSKEYKLYFSHSQIIEELGIKNKNYIPIIKDTLKSLRETTVEQKNFREGRKVYKSKSMGLISSYGDYIEDGSSEKMFEVEITKTLFNEMMKANPGYTELHINNIKSLSSINHIRLYEFIKKNQNMKIVPALKLNDLNELFLTNFINLGKSEELIRRAIKAINSKTDIIISYEKDKKKKTISFIIDKVKQTTAERKKQKFATKKTIEEDKAIEYNLKAKETRLNNLKEEVNKKYGYQKKDFTEERAIEIAKMEIEINKLEKDIEKNKPKHTEEDLEVIASLLNK